MEVRPPAVAGRFYPGTARDIASALAELAPHAPAHRAIAAMCPHAGWVYSGATAMAVLGRIAVPEVVVVLCPNHTGKGARVSIWPDGAWQTPIGAIPIDAALAARIATEAHAIRGAKLDRAAHREEHAIEVLVPMLAARQPALRLVPIVVGHLDADECIALGHALARAVAGEHADALVIASSDMSHYLPEPEARRLDALALEALETGDPRELLAVVDGHDISMCGARPAAAMLAYAHARGAGPPELVAYATSGDAFGDRARVVGYAGAVVPAA
ncbi:MAG: AmmeMemoRadiSam system protein B [Deltaproteobacteria bacterium]|nr:AmmeMemoRadiSam system protein B [Deltaproteobacteria bacterium]